MPGLDVIDEMAHYDYALQLRGGHVPAWGDVYSQSTLRVIACVGLTGSVVPGSCGSGYRNPKQFAPAGYDYEAQQPPLGYIPYALTATTNADGRQAIILSRRGGILWTAISGVLLLVLGMLEELSILEMAALLAIALLNPFFVHAAATVNNDAAALAAGTTGPLALAYSRRRGGRGTTVGLVAGVIIGMLKGLFIVVPFALVVRTVLIEAPWRRGHRSIRRLWDAGRCEWAMLIAAGVSFLGWTMLQNHRARVPSSTVLHSLMSFSMSSHLRFDQILVGTENLFNMFTAYYTNTPFYYILNLALMGTVVGAVVMRDGVTFIRSFRAESLGIVFGLVALAIGWPTLVFLQGHYSFAAAGRYGIPLVTLVALLVIRVATRRSLLIIGVVGPLVGAAAQFAVVGY